MIDISDVVFEFIYFCLVFIGYRVVCWLPYGYFKTLKKNAFKDLSTPFKLRYEFISASIRVQLALIGAVGLLLLPIMIALLIIFL